MAIFRIKNLTYKYPDKVRPAVENINMDIREGELVLLVGPSGCGKSTLLRLLSGLAPGFYGGTISGNIFFKDEDIIHKRKTLAPAVGLLFQDPEKQIVMTDVEREIVFGMENLGVKTEIIKRRLGETVDFMGIKDLLKRKTSELSAGEKQKVAFASILAMNPDVLLMDEPTSQMDPISAEELLNTVRKIAEDTGKTIIMAEQKLERCLHMADKIIALDQGGIVFNGKAREYCEWAHQNQYEFLPTIPKIFGETGMEQIPITVKEGRKAIADFLKSNVEENKKGDLDALKIKDANKMQEKVIEKKGQPEIQIKNLWFSYAGDDEVLKGINLNIFNGEFVCIVGQNGAGKTTLAKNINGLLRPSRGEVKVNGENIKNKSISKLATRIGYLGQNPDSYLLNDSVEEEIQYTLKNFNLPWNEDIDLLMNELGLKDFKRINPRDLSTGQRQRTALASVLSVSPDILILDEPTRGMDYQNKKSLSNILSKLKEKEKTIILVTHDIEFASELPDRVIIMFNGEITADGKREDVLKNNLYYSSQINKLSHGFDDIAHIPLLMWERDRG